MRYETIRGVECTKAEHDAWVAANPPPEPYFYRGPVEPATAEELRRTREVMDAMRAGEPRPAAITPAPATPQPRPAPSTQPKAEQTKPRPVDPPATVKIETADQRRANYVMDLKRRHTAGGPRPTGNATHDAAVAHYRQRFAPKGGNGAA